MKKIVAALIILAAVLVCYAPVTHDGFVWDDTALILRDPLIRSWRLVSESFNHFLFLDATASDFYRPLQRLTYLADYAAFGLRPGPFHVISVFWHGAAAITLLLFADEFLTAFGLKQLQRRLIAFAAALIWAIHPVQTAAIVYISGRADPLCATFGFLGCYFLLQQSRSTGAKKWLGLVAGLIALLLSLFSKEMGITFPILLLCFFALRKNWLEIGKTVAVTALICVIYLPLRAGAEHFPAPELSPPAPPLVRPIIIARAVAEYAGLLLFPLHLHMDRTVETQPSGMNPTSLAQASLRELQTLLGVVLIAALVYWMWRARKRNPPVFASLLFVVIAYLPVSGLIALNASVAEHWVYLPSAFLFLAAAIEIGGRLEGGALLATLKLREGGPRPKSSDDTRRGEQAAVVPPRPSKFAQSIAVAVVALWVIFLGARTFVRTFDWKDQRTFVESTIDQGGDSARMLINLGVLELNEGRVDDAAVHLHAALEKKPDQPLAILNLGALALKQNDFKLARELLVRATKSPLVEAEANELLAVLENKESKKVDLLRMRLAVHTGQPKWSIEKRYIQVLDESGNRSAAIAELINCLGTQWYRAESWQLLSQLETKAGHPDRAANALAQAHAYDVRLDEH